MFMNGHATKDDYVKALRAYQAYLVEIKRPQRDESAAFSDGSCLNETDDSIKTNSSTISIPGEISINVVFSFLV